MDVDCTVVALKRSSSAPIINEIPASMSIASPSGSGTATRDPQSGCNGFTSAGGTPRARRFSTSAGSCSTGLRLTPRVSQLRQEECLDVAGREAAHEKEIHSAMQISQSWEDLTIEAEGLSFKDSEPGALRFKIERQIAKRVLDPLAINLSLGAAPAYSSPSPTRQGLGLAQRQCYSPGIHPTWKSSLSPSPTRKAFATRRSLSPIAIRPSCLGSVKRKFELDDASSEQRLQPPAKKPSGLLTSAFAGTTRLDRHLSSPYPGTHSSAGTPESLSSLDSGFTFRPVDGADSPSSELSSEPSEPVESSKRRLDRTRETGNEPTKETTREEPVRIDRIIENPENETPSDLVLNSC